MKKLILLALVAVIMAGCTKGKASYTDDLIVNIAGCEYIKQKIYEGDGFYIYTHIGNCRFCAERRKAELEELVEQLKEK